MHYFPTGPIHFCTNSNTVFLTIFSIKCGFNIVKHQLLFKWVLKVNIKFSIHSFNLCFCSYWWWSISDVILNKYMPLESSSIALIDQPASFKEAFTISSSWRKSTPIIYSHLSSWLTQTYIIRMLHTYVKGVVHPKMTFCHHLLVFMLFQSCLSCWSPHAKRIYVLIYKWSTY